MSVASCSHCGDWIDSEYDDNSYIYINNKAVCIDCCTTKELVEYDESL